MYDEALAFPESICSWLQQDKEIMEPALRAAAQRAAPAPSQVCCHVSECMATASMKKKERCKGVEEEALNEKWLVSTSLRAESGNTSSFP